MKNYQEMEKTKAEKGTLRFALHCVWQTEVKNLFCAEYQGKRNVAAPLLGIWFSIALAS